MRDLPCKIMKNYRLRLFATGLCLIMVVLMVLSAYHYYSDRSMVMGEIDQRLYAGATALRYSVADGFHNCPLDKNTKLDHSYSHTTSQLKRLARDLNLKKLYTFIVLDDAVYQTLSADWPPPSVGDVSEGGFVRCRDVEDQIFTAHRGTEPLYYDAENGGGRYRAILIPYVTTDGYRYLAGARVDISLNSDLAETFQRALLQCAILLILSFPLTALFVWPLLCQLYTHELTGLPNRARLKKDLVRCRLPQLILIDIDGFKDINHYYGVQVGDQLLLGVANCLKSLIPAGTKLYKLDGDEYALLSESSPRCVSVDYLVSRINEQRINIKDTEFRLSVTAGVAQGTTQLIEHADLALKEAKRVLKPHKHYSSYLHTVQNSQANLLWTYKLKDAIDSDRIIAYFQPIYDNKAQVISHYETLVRLMESDGTIVGPTFFMEAARRSRVYNQLTLHVIDAAFKFIERYGKCCTVNLLNEDIVVEESRQQIIDRIRKAKGREKLIFEIVESEGIDDYDVIKSFIDQVRVYGVRVAIDDFGTGYSNFDHISHLDIDYIKIDGGLIEQLSSSERSRTIVEAIIHFAKELEIDTIAEYVSDERLQEIVQEMGIDYSQGYHIGNPQCIDKTGQMLNTDDI